MKLPLALLLLIVPLSRAAGPQDPSFRQGEEALADGLWDVAALHFEQMLGVRTLTAEEKAVVILRLAEAWIRDGESGKALKLLGDPSVLHAPGVHFWRGQALAGSGRPEDAEKELHEASQPDRPFATEATFTRAALLLSLGRTDDALAALRALDSSPDPDTAVETRLRQVEILLDHQRTGKAREIMPPSAGIPERKAAQANYLEGRLLLAENKPVPAAERFFSLMSQRSGQNLFQRHAATLGYADALAAQNRKSESSDVLLTFIQENPTSPLLAGAFSRLAAWLPTDLTLSDPVLLKLTQWAAPAMPAAGKPAASLARGLIRESPTGIDGASPEPAPSDPIVIHAAFTLAKGLHRLPAPAQKAQASRLMMWIQLTYPEHPLAAQAWLQSARWLLEEGKKDQAFAILDYLRETSPDLSAGSEAAFLQAEASYRDGQFAEAIRLFDEAAHDFGPGNASDAARLNAALARFRETGTMAIALSGGDDAGKANTQLEADLELEQALAASPPDSAKAALETFIKKHPNHPRTPEARLAAAEAALTAEDEDDSYALAQLDTIASDPAALASVSPVRYALARLRLTEHSGDPAATIAAAKAFVEKFPGDPSAAEASLTLGRILYSTGNYNDARLVLQKLADTDEDPVRKQAALLLAASSAARVGTPQSREEALDLFDKAGATKGPLNALVMMKKAQLMIDLNRVEDATDFLRKWYQSLPATDPLRLPAGFLFGDAAYPQGTKNPAVLDEALAIYDELLKHPETKPADIHRIQYMRGKTLEQLPRRDDPTQKRESEALAAYYSVLENAENPPAEWHFLESSGFRALEILERSREKKARAALNIARKIASLKGPRSKEAADRAQDIQLKNQIWED